MLILYPKVDITLQQFSRLFYATYSEYLNIMFWRCTANMIIKSGYWALVKMLLIIDGNLDET